MEERKNKTGFTLIELLITMAIMTIVLAVIYSVYMSGEKSTRSLGLTSTMQLNAQSAIDYMNKEIKLAGYNLPTGAGPSIVNAGNNSLMFAYRDDSVSPLLDDNGVSFTNGTQLRRTNYYILGSEIRRATWRATQAGSTYNWVFQSDQPIINGVALLNYVYYDGYSNTVGAYTMANGISTLTNPDPLTPALITNVVSVNVSVETQEAQNDPVLGILKTYKASGMARMINMGATPLDCTQPPVVTGVTAISNGVCGKLVVSWSPVNDSYLQGYVVNVQSGGYTYSYSAPSNATSISVGDYYVDSNGNYQYDLMSGVPASVTVTDEDICGYISNPSSAATATPSAAPPDIPGPIAVINSGDTVTLSWPQGTNPQDTDVSYYHVYRSAGGSAYTFIGNATGIYNISYADNVPQQDTCTPLTYLVNAVNACTGAASAANSASISVYDPTVPATPSGVTGKSGYRRNFLNWTNPSDALLNSIAIRYNSACSGNPGYPQSLTDGTGVENPNAGETVVNGQIMNATPGPGQSYIHTGPGNGQTGYLPDLGYSTPGYTACTDYQANYDYTIFAVSHCGIASNATNINELTASQCGEETSGCAAGAPTWNNSGCSNVSDSKADLTLVNNNGGPYTLTWNRIDDSSGAIYDLAGYYIYGLTGTGSFNNNDTDAKVSGLVLNPAIGYQPQWADPNLAQGGYPSVDDNPGTQGTTHQYYVIPIDCNRETNMGEDPWAAYANAPTPPPTSSAMYGGLTTYSGNILSVQPGRITFSKPSAPAITYYSSTPADPAVVTGQLSLTNPPSSYSNFMRNRVNFYAYNDSAAPVQLDSFNLSWSNTDAHLARVWRMDTGTCIWGTCAGGTPSISNTATVNLTAAPGTGAIQLGGVTGSTCNTGGGTNGALCYLPLKMAFTDPNGNVTSSQNMVGVTVNVDSLTYEKIFSTNSSQSVTQNFSCTMPSPRISTGAWDNIVNPLGPYFLNNSTQHTALQVNGVNYTSNTTPGSEFPYGATFNVLAQLYDSSGTGLAGVDLYYATTPQDQGTPPSISNFSNQIPMSVNAHSGNQYTYITSTPLNVSKNDRVWYLLLDKDNQGNWDEAPEQTYGGGSGTAYSFDVSNPCSDTPNPPTGLFATTSPSVIVNGTTGNSITVNWTAPTTNTTGTTLADLAGCNVYVAVNGVLNTTPVYYGACSGSFTDSVTGNNQPSGTLIQYAVIAYDMCHQLGPAEYPGRNISSGNPGSNIIQVQ